jgi:hypothetical protein
MYIKYLAEAKLNVRAMGLVAATRKQNPWDLRRGVSIRESWLHSDLDNTLLEDRHGVPASTTPIRTKFLKNTQLEAYLCLVP